LNQTQLMTSCSAFRQCSGYGHLRHLSQWIAAAANSEVYALQRVAKALKRDRDAIRNAILEPWSSGQVEGQINGTRPR
jgi:transposase